jgi:hypothetical protein
MGVRVCVRVRFIYNSKDIQLYEYKYNMHMI